MLEWKSMIKAILLNLSFFYLAMLAFAFFFANAMIFLPPSPGYHSVENFLKLETKDNKTIFAVYLPNKAAKYTLLFSHGNAEDIGYMLPFLRELHAHGFSVFAYDYHGYGLSRGLPSENNCYLDVDAAYEYLTQVAKIAPQNIIAHGRSVGAAVSLDLAIKKPIAGLIMESPFVTAFRVLTKIPLLPFDKFNNLKKIKSLTYPLLVIHGTADNIVAPWHSKMLYEKAKVPKKIFWVEGADHNNVLYTAGENYWRVLNDFVAFLNESVKPK